MAQYRVPNPFDPHFALPDNVMAEPPGRGTLTTMQRQRRSFDTPGYTPPSWSAHFDIPKYIKAEPIGRGAMHAQWARRKTIPTLIPNALGDVIEPGSPDDPFTQYGQRVSEILVDTIHRVPPGYRKIALHAVLDELEPGLSEKVTKRANKYKDKGMAPTEALKAAIASSVSEGLTKEIIKIGKTGKLPSVKSLPGLGLYSEAFPLALDGLWSSIKSGVSKTAGAVTGTVTGGAKWVGGKVSSGAQWTAGKVASGAKTAYNWGKTALSKIKGVTCAVMKDPLSDVAAGGAAAAFGAPPQVGTMGKQLAQGISCPPGTVPVSQEDLATEGSMSKNGLPSWALPVGVGAAGIVAVLLLTGGKKES